MINMFQSSGIYELNFIFLRHNFELITHYCKLVMKIMLVPSSGLQNNYTNCILQNFHKDIFIHEMKCLQQHNMSSQLCLFIQQPWINIASATHMSTYALISLLYGQLRCPLIFSKKQESGYRIDFQSHQPHHLKDFSEAF